MIALTVVEDLGVAATAALVVLVAVTLAVVARRGLLVRIRQEDP